MHAVYDYLIGCLCLLSAHKAVKVDIVPVLIYADIRIRGPVSVEVLCAVLSEVLEDLNRDRPEVHIVEIVFSHGVLIVFFRFFIRLVVKSLQLFLVVSAFVRTGYLVLIDVVISFVYEVEFDVELIPFFQIIYEIFVGFFLQYKMTVLAYLRCLDFFCGHKHGIVGHVDAGYESDHQGEEDEYDCVFAPFCAKLAEHSGRERIPYGALFFCTHMSSSLPLELGSRYPAEVHIVVSHDAVSQPYDMISHAFYGLVMRDYYYGIAVLLIYFFYEPQYLL